MRAPEEAELVADIKRVAAKLGITTLSRSQYLQHGQFSGYHIYDGGRTWESLCHAAGVTSMKVEPVPDEEYFARLRHAVQVLGRYPKVSERKRFGLNFRKARYPTLQSFVRKAIELGVIEPLEPMEEPEPESDDAPPAEPDSLDSPATVLRSEPDSRVVPPIPAATKRLRWSRVGLDGHPYAPHDELGVVAVFGILCHRRIIDWQILDLSCSGIDAVCFDHVMGREIRVELKYILSRTNWNHTIEDLDYVVCWENRWPDFPKPVIELRTLVAGSSV
jgi:hypothetical protein